MRDKWWLKAIALALVAMASWTYLSCLHCDGDECCDDPFDNNEATCHCACAFCFVYESPDSNDPRYHVSGSAVLSDHGLLSPDIAQRHFRPPRTALI